MGLYEHGIGKLLYIAFVSFSERGREKLREAQRN